MAAAVILGAASCAGREDAVVDCADFTVTPSEFHMEFAGRAGGVTEQEHTFICRGTIYGRAQVAFARMAQQRAASSAVVRYAERALGEQETLNRRLDRIAVQEDGIIPPAGLDVAHLAARDRLSGLSGDAFDRAYLETEIRDGQAAIADFKEEVASGAEPLLNKFAAAALSQVEQRVQLAQSMIGQ